MPEKQLTMDMHSTSSSLKFSLDGVLFTKYSVALSFQEIRTGVIRDLKEEFKLSHFEAEGIWIFMEIEK